MQITLQNFILNYTTLLQLLQITHLQFFQIIEHILNSFSSFISIPHVIETNILIYNVTAFLGGLGVPGLGGVPCVMLFPRVLRLLCDRPGLILRHLLCRNPTPITMYLFIRLPFY